MNTPVITYGELAYLPNYSFLVTGVRRLREVGDEVILTGSSFPIGESETSAVIYRGSLTETDSSNFHTLIPRFHGQEVVSATFYGPNTPLFNPNLARGNVQAVGSYTYQNNANPKFNHGMMYVGSVEGLGTWTQIDVPNGIAGGEVANTIAHSVMGDLVVGDYDVMGKPLSANAFIYDTRTGHFQVLDIGPLTTAYGIWQNGGYASSSHTITGGYRDDSGINQGFLLDYDSVSHQVTNLKSFTYTYNSKTEACLLTHFEGISSMPGGYSLAAQLTRNAAWATVPRMADGSFGDATWVPIVYPGYALCTGNSVLDNHIVGVYKTDNEGIQSYVATVSLEGG